MTADMLAGAAIMAFILVGGWLILREPTRQCDCGKVELYRGMDYDDGWRWHTSHGCADHEPFDA